MSGTRESLEGLVAAEHRRIDSLFAQLLADLREGGENRALRNAFSQLQNQLEAHLAREDCLYYPALRALRPAHREPLAGIIAAHDTFRSQLVRIETSLAQSAIETALRSLESLASLFAAHEVAEEQMLHEIDREIRAEDLTSAG